MNFSSRLVPFLLAHQRNLIGSSNKCPLLIGRVVRCCHDNATDRRHHDNGCHSNAARLKALDDELRRNSVASALTGCHSNRGETGCHSNRDETGCHSNRDETGCHSNRGETGCHSNEVGSELMRKTQERFGSEYCCVFMFPYIRHCRFACRLKLYQTALCTTLPPAMYLNNADPATIAQACGFCAFTLVTLALVGELARHMVGAIYLSIDGATVIISRLTFFGRRYDVTLPLDDVTPVGDSGEAGGTGARICTLRRYSQPRQRFYMTLRCGGVLDENKLALIIGTIEHSSDSTASN